MNFRFSGRSSAVSRVLQSRCGGLQIPGRLILSPAARSRASIDATNMAAWREAGAAGFGIGSAIYKSGDTPEMAAAKARALLSAAAKA
jgi:hypothetical protein